MRKQKISFFALGFVSGILAGYFFAQWQYRLGVLSPCNQSATTTDCLALSELQPGTTPPPVYPEKPETVVQTHFSFGSLTNTYEDKEFGFSLKYPDELEIIPFDDCPSLVDQMTDGIGFAIHICNQNTISGFRNPRATSLDDYRRDYSLTAKDFEVFAKYDVGVPLTDLNESIRIHIKKSEDITTVSGVKGLKQIFTSEYFDLNTGISLSAQRTPGQVPVNNKRYVFYHPQKGAIAISVLRPYPTLEDAIIQSVSY